MLPLTKVGHASWIASLKHDEKSSESLLQVFTVSAVEQSKHGLFADRKLGVKLAVIMGNKFALRDDSRGKMNVYTVNGGFQISLKFNSPAF